jgi:hypothetical protein
MAGHNRWIGILLEVSKLHPTVYFYQHGLGACWQGSSLVVFALQENCKQAEESEYGIPDGQEHLRCTERTLSKDSE